MMNIMRELRRGRYGMVVSNLILQPNTISLKRTVDPRKKKVRPELGFALLQYEMLMSLSQSGNINAFGYSDVRRTEGNTEYFCKCIQELEVNGYQISDCKEVSRDGYIGIQWKEPYYDTQEGVM